MTDARERVNRDHYDNEYVVTDARERLEAAIRDVLVNVSIGTSLVQQIADAVERALAPEPPAPHPVWPVPDAAVSAYMNTPDDNQCCHFQLEPWCPTCHRNVATALTAAAPYLWRALVASLPREADLSSDCVWIGDILVRRAALAALADPYDGGAK